MNPFVNGSSDLWFDGAERRVRRNKWPWQILYHQIVDCLISLHALVTWNPESYFSLGTNFVSNAYAVPNQFRISSNRFKCCLAVRVSFTWLGSYFYSSNCYLSFKDRIFAEAYRKDLPRVYIPLPTSTSLSPILLEGLSPYYLAPSSDISYLGWISEAWHHWF